MPPDNYWHDEQLRKVVANWTYWIYCSYYQRSKTYREILDLETMLHGMHDTANCVYKSASFTTSPLSLSEILGLPQGFNPAQDIIEQVMLGFPDFSKFLSLYAREKPHSAKGRRTINTGQRLTGNFDWNQLNTEEIREPALVLPPETGPECLHQLRVMC
jgi:hypothetical protein